MGGHSSIQGSLNKRLPMPIIPTLNYPERYGELWSCKSSVT